MIPPGHILPSPSLSATVDHGSVRITLDARVRRAVDGEFAEPSPARIVRPDAPPTRRRQRVVCQACGAAGHNRRNVRCPARRGPGA